jgi:hypothetical protein
MEDNEPAPALDGGGEEGAAWSDGGDGGDCRGLDAVEEASGGKRWPGPQSSRPKGRSERGWWRRRRWRRRWRRQ